MGPIPVVSPGLAGLAECHDMTPSTDGEPNFYLSGDRCLLITYGEQIDLEINRQVHRLTAHLRHLALSGVEALIPAYSTLAVTYNPLAVSVSDLKAHLRTAMATLPPEQAAKARVVDIPVCYGGELGPDLAFVARHHNLSAAEVIARHSAAPYHIYTIGFAPGFCYLGGLDPRLKTPRLETPRTLVPAGSVGIAEAQTGVYPLASPGGWRLIGRTPLRLFDADRSEPFLYQAGDSIRFVPIEYAEYERLSREEAV